MSTGTLLLSATEVERLLTPDACFAAVEDAFRQLAAGNVPAPGILGMHAKEGSFHVKAAQLEAGQPYFAAKLNANFPLNGTRYGLPTIQGVVALCDAANGALLALIDSISITKLRTAAATAVAARYLARDNSETALLCGCGGQAAAQLRAIARVCPIKKIRVYDQDRAKAAKFASDWNDPGVAVTTVPHLAEAALISDVIITCTTSQRYFLTPAMVRPGTFVAAVGADGETKQEIDPALMAAACVVTDVTDQAATIGDLHHAIAAGAMSREGVYAELQEVVSEKKHGRTSVDQTFIFDSTGTGLQDVAAAIAVYREALATDAGTRFRFSPS